MPTIEQLRAQLSGRQHAILNAIWGYFAERTEWPTTRRVHHQFGKEEARAAIEQLGGSIAWDTQFSDGSRYQLTVIGVLLTDAARDGVDLLARYLGYVRDRYLDDPDVARVTSGELVPALGLSLDQSRLLRRLVELGRFCGGSSSFGGPDWYAGVPREIDDLPTVPDLRAYVEGRVMAEYDPTLPVDAQELSHALHLKIRAGPVAEHLPAG